MARQTKRGVHGGSGSGIAGSVGGSSMLRNTPGERWMLAIAKPSFSCAIRAPRHSDEAATIVSPGTTRCAIAS